MYFEFISKFQFLNGTIKSEIRHLIVQFNSQFQFLNGLQKF